VDGLGGLKAIGYHQYISLKCGTKKGQDPEKAISTCSAMVRQQ